MNKNLNKKTNRSSYIDLIHYSMNIRHNNMLIKFIVMP